MTQEEQQLILDKILVVKDYLSCKDMEEEFSIPGTTIRRICNKHGIELLSPKQVAINYMKDMAARKTLSQIARKLKMNEYYLEKLAKEEGITLTHVIKKHIPDPTKTYVNRIRLNEVRDFTQEIWNRMDL